MNIPRNQYPRPQMVRDNWQNLNGIWEFEFDFGNSGIERGMLQKDKYDMEIKVPFCPESELSEINFKDFINALWYRKNFEIPSDWKNGRILLHFEAVDYNCQVWINNNFAGSHKGGYTPFSFDITEYLNDDKNTVTVYVQDDVRSGLQPRGKQCGCYNSRGCDYTRTTGIWQTVWFEYVPKTYIKSYKIIPDTDNSKVDITAYIEGITQQKTLTATAIYNDKIVGKTSIKTTGSFANISLNLSELHLWQPLDAKLYDLKLELETNDEIDSVTGYFGMRKIEIGNKAVLINEKPVFQRLVLDQGFYPDGIYTAPDDEALLKDIELSINLGFNGARLHQKVFERRFLYHADKMGYLVWGEYGNWGLNHSKAEALEIFLPEWIEVVDRDFNSPALIGWCPFNETWDIEGHKQDDKLLKNVYLVTKAMDSTRPVIDTSGNFHVITDIYDIHNYTQDVEKFEQDFLPMATGGEVYDNFPQRQKYEGQPYFVSEYGGICWNPKNNEGWGYGNKPKTIEEYVDRYIGLTDVLLKNPNIFALCYTQLYDIEQEVNGIYYYDRSPKFTPETMNKLKNAMRKPAAIEQI